MRWITFALTIATVAGLIAYTPPASIQGDGDAAPIYGIKIPTGYRDWPMISAALVGGPVNDLRVKLGGWGFAQFTNGKPDAEAVHKTCFVCHAPAKDSDFVFTRYSP
ncbi:MAG TPA: cytochrome P460 family protein [Pyrinomonadaceae bacterium]|nr:cytochrome P460 family protein [Pyrinomonadaceae bacterium]